MSPAFNDSIQYTPPQIISEVYLPTSVWPHTPPCPPSMLWLCLAHPVHDCMYITHVCSYTCKHRDNSMNHISCWGRGVRYHTGSLHAKDRTPGPIAYSYMTVSLSKDKDFIWGVSNMQRGPKGGRYVHRCLYQNRAHLRFSPPSAIVCCRPRSREDTNVLK